MLNVLQHKNIGEIVVVVSRYFGGIKLGAGGLVRAYSSAVQQAVEALPLKLHTTTLPAIIHLPFALESQIRHLLDGLQIDIMQTLYQNSVEMHVEVELGRELEFEEAVINASSGSASVTFPRIQR